MTEGEKVDWDFAKARFDRIRQQYLDLDGVPGINVQFALQLTFTPLAERYNSGERTDELFLEMMEVV